MLKGIEELKDKLAKVMENDDILEVAKTISGLEIAISNGLLLSDSLISFYNEEKAIYFPNAITDEIEVYIRDANAQLTTLLTKKNTTGKQLQINLDKLYALCLQSGLISFGFTTKELDKIVDSAKREVQALAKKVGVVNDEIDKQIQEFKKSADEKKAELNSYLITSNELKDKISQIERETSDTKKGLEQLLNSADALLQRADKVQSECIQRRTSIDDEVKNAKSFTSQLQTTLDNANQIVSQITAKASTADENLSVIKERKKAADEFYTTVEDYKDDMLTATKEGSANYTDLKASCDKKIAEYSAKTDEIIQQNTAYQEEIKELLTKAVSGGLFKVFNQRQLFLYKGTRFWKWAVIVSSILVAGGILFVAWAFETKPDIIFFVRLAIMIPLAFLMFFSATQYKKERIAEEEYAFKSAISLSLEPYRDLLVRMRKEDQLEADFVKKLMEDVFDNPVMRMFDIEEEEERIAKLIMSYLKKLPTNRVTSIIETIVKDIAEKK